MAFKFKSQATSDLLMLSAHAQALLQHIGKSAEGSGILTPQEMPAALATLKALPGDEPSAEEAQAKSDESAQDQGPAEGMVSLRQRAWPLVQMIERAHAADKPIVWGV
jgi:hypothetical protein